MSAKARAGAELERIDALRGHEKTDPFHLRQLRDEILRDGHQRDPIVIDGRTSVILDGHHRAEIFAGLDLKRIAVHRVDYSSPNVSVLSWVPTFDIDPERAIDMFSRAAVARASGTGNPGAALVWKEGMLGLAGDRHGLMGVLVGSVQIHYAKDESEARDVISAGKAKAFLVLPPVSKDEVIRSALSGHKLPPKTTRHVFSSRPASVFVPLRELA